MQSKSARYPSKLVMLISLEVLRTLMNFHFQEIGSDHIVSPPGIKPFISKHNRSQQGCPQSLKKITPKPGGIWL